MLIELISDLNAVESRYYIFEFRKKPEAVYTAIQMINYPIVKNM